MDLLTSLLPLVHLVGLALGVGAATVKLVLLLKCSTDRSFVPVCLRVFRPITQLILAGMLLLTLSGISWLLLGYPFSFLLGLKIALVVSIWMLGPVIDRIIEPKFKALAPAAQEPVSPEFTRVRNQYVRLEILANLLFYSIIGIWMLG